MKRQNWNFLGDSCCCRRSIFRTTMYHKINKQWFWKYRAQFMRINILSKAEKWTIKNINSKFTLFFEMLSEIWTCARNRVVSMIMDKSQNQNKPVWAPTFEIEISDRYFRKQKYNEKAFSICFYFLKTKSILVASVSVGSQSLKMTFVLLLFRSKPTKLGKKRHK